MILVANIDEGNEVFVLCIVVVEKSYCTMFLISLYQYLHLTISLSVLFDFLFLKTKKRAEWVWKLEMATSALVNTVYI